MSESLYTKYRPRAFKDVVGQQAVVRSLQSVLAKGTNRAIMLAGPSGTGKTTLARIAATVLEYQTQDIDAATHTGIEAMKDVIRGLSYKPLDKAAKGKVLIIDECHRLSGQAFDSMLKVLEEPPAWVRFFLCTTDVAKVPKAVQTRCTTYTLKAVPHDELFEMLDGVAAAENVLTGKEGGKILSLCAKQAGGSPRQALVNLTACLDAVTVAEARELLQSVELDNAQAVELARALIGGKSWLQVQEILVGLKGQPAEGIRHVVRAYATNVVLNNTTGKNLERPLAVLEAFGTPFNSTDQLSPLVLAVGTLLFAN